LYYQRERVFPTAEKLTSAERRLLASRENPNSPFHHIIGNAAAVEQSELIIFHALGRRNHRASDLNLAWIGSAGVGKTMFARSIAKALELPFIETGPNNIKNPQDLFNEMQRVLSRSTDAWGRSLEMVKQSDGSYFAPSCIVFIDEAHQLGSVAQTLLQATEPSTHMLEGRDIRLDTQAVMWQFATTDRGLLFDAFDTRFMKIELQPYNRQELSQIVHIHYKDIPLSICDLIVKYYSLITRETLDAARIVRMEKNMRGGSWETAVDIVRKRDGIDEYGLSRKRLAVLKTLGNGKKSIAALANAAGIKQEEMEKFVLPPLMAHGDDFEPLVETASGGRYITEAGLAELDKRHVAHKGRAVLSKTSCLT